MAGLVMLQVVAFSTQFARGFMPLAHEGTRVPFSWDMFSVRIERCDLSWDPPIHLGGGLSRLHEVAAPFEWDSVGNSRATYVFLAREGCRFAEPGARAFLTCFTPEGEQVEYEDTCGNEK